MDYFLILTSDDDVSYSSIWSEMKEELTQKKVKTIRAGIGLNDQHPQFKALVKYQEIVEEKTEGKIKMDNLVMTIQ